LSAFRLALGSHPKAIFDGCLNKLDEVQSRGVVLRTSAVVFYVIGHEEIDVWKIVVVEGSVVDRALKKALQ
jgi:hypothetical protein